MSIVLEDDDEGKVEIAKVLMEFMKDLKNVDGKTELKSDKVKLITAVEVLHSVIQTDLGFNETVLSELVKRYKVNQISLDRKGRLEFVEVAKRLLTGQEDMEQKQLSKMRRLFAGV